MTFVARGYQSDCVDVTRLAWLKHRSVLNVLATGLGKAQPLKARVLTPWGWRMMAQINHGDLVIGADGSPVMVESVHPQGKLQTFTVTCSDGTETRCCANHLWSVQTKSQKARTGQFSTKRTEELIDDLKDGSGSNKWFLPNVAPIKFWPFDLPIDPYLVGFLIGDGGITQNCKFSCADNQIIERISSTVARYRLVVKHDQGYDYSISQGQRTGKPNVITTHLRDLGLLGKGSHEKFIPEMYAFSSVEHRVELLRGLMDTDGSITPDGHAEFSTTSLVLAKDFCALVRSLGGCTTVRRKKAGVFTHKGIKKVGRISYRVTVSLQGINPFWLPRKSHIVKDKPNQGQTKAIVSIRPFGVEECKCIKIENPNGLYVTDDFIVTHNTEIAAIMMNQDKRSLFLVHRDELVRQTVEKLKQRHGYAPCVEKADLTHDPSAAGDVVASVQSCQHQRLARFRASDFGQIIVDEAHHCTAPTYRKVLDHFPDAKVVGFTATANRTDKKAMELVFERCATDTGAAFYYPIAKGTNEGWLVPLTCNEIIVKGLDLSKVKVSKETGDYNQRDLDRAMSEEGVIHEIAGPLLEMSQGRQGIVFCAGVDEAVMLTKVLNKLTGKSSTAAAIHCNTKKHPIKKQKRRGLVQNYKDGAIQFLVNFGVLTEGFDAPNTYLIANARPTTSSLIVTQMLGRGTRPTVNQGLLGAAETAYDRRQLIRESDKPQCLVLDFKGKTASAVKLASCEDALGGEYDDEIKQRAKKYRDNGRSVTENLELAAAWSDLEAQMASDRTWFRPEVIYESKQVDLYGHAAGQQEVVGQSGATATDKQRRYLWVLHKQLNIPWDEGKARSWTKGQAGAIINNLRSKSSSRIANTGTSNSG